jgi:hypothetical protein
MKNSRPARAPGGGVKTPAVSSTPAKDSVPGIFKNKKGGVSEIDLRHRAIDILRSGGRQVNENTIAIMVDRLRARKVEGERRKKRGIRRNFIEAGVESEGRELEALLKRDDLEAAELRPVDGVPEITHPDDSERYERQLGLVYAWFFEMWERMSLNDDQSGHEARVELQTLLLNTMGQVFRVAQKSKAAVAKKWAGELLAIIGERIRKHNKNLCKANVRYAEMKKKLSGKSLASVFFPKWIGQIVQRELKEAELHQKHLLLLKVAYGKKWKEAAKRESIPEAYYATAHLPELRKKKFQNDTKAKVYLEKAEKRWWDFLWPLISKKIEAKLPKVKQSFEHSGTFYPSRYDKGAGEHLHLIVCLRVKGVL